MLTESEIRKHLATSLIGRRIAAFDVVESTNARAKLLSGADPEEGLLVIADEQTAGRGRQGRSWQSRPGMNLTFSVVLVPSVPASRIGVVSLLAGIAVAEAVEEVAGLASECKWPNDVLVGGKKICGILCESVLRGETPATVIAGIGVNVNQEDFPAELRDGATSLARETGRSFDRPAVLSRILGRLEHRYLQLQRGEEEEIRRSWKERASMMGTFVLAAGDNSVVGGIARDIADDGSLLLDVQGREIRVAAADVTLTHPRT